MNALDGIDVIFQACNRYIGFGLPVGKELFTLHRVTHHVLNASHESQANLKGMVQ